MVQHSSWAHHSEAKFDLVVLRSSNTSPEVSGPPCLSEQCDSSSAEVRSVLKLSFFSTSRSRSIPNDHDQSFQDDYGGWGALDLGCEGEIVDLKIN